MTGAGGPRPAGAVPRAVTRLLLAAVLLQLGWHALAPKPSAQSQNLPAPPAAMLLEIASLGDSIALAKILMLWLQAHDVQPGGRASFLDLDYRRVTGWLDRILTLDPASRYPLLAASRLYGTVPAPRKQRHMLEFVYQRFLDDPERRWSWLAHAAILARYRLNDLPRSMRFAQAIRERATGDEVPDWARRTPVVLLEQSGELDATRILIGGLLANGLITDPHELNFLERELQRLEAASQGQRDDAAATWEDAS